MARYTSRDCICEGTCGNTNPEACAKFDGKWLCYDCWHQAREATSPYHVRSKRNPQGRYSNAARIPVVYTYEEAMAQAAKMGEDFEPVPAPNWCGERRSHPGYMARRRAAIVAEHPEYK